MKAVIELLVKELVDRPEAVVVDEIEEQESDRVFLEVHVARDDTGKVIGRQGRIANALREVARVASAVEGRRAQLEIISD